MSAKKNNISFEESISKLEDIVNALEGGELTLDESVARFGEAIGLVKQCSEKLDNAKQKVKLLTKNADGTVCDVPFVDIDDET